MIVVVFGLLVGGVVLTFALLLWLRTKLLAYYRDQGSVSLTWREEHIRERRDDA